jgi:2-oxoglutarate dehydrogenase E2 component (dihydrolipoamide succinyltransferase)
MDVIMPQLGETVAEGIVTRWYKKVGDTVKADELLFDVETDKVSTEIPAPVAGVVSEILVAEGVTAKVGVRLAVIREAGVAQTAPTREAAVPAVTVGAAVTPAAASAPAAPSRPRAPAGERLSPVVRRLIAEHSLDAHTIDGTGRDGRITREDVLAHIASAATAPPSRAPVPGVRAEAAARAPAMPSTDAGASSVPHNSVRRRVAENMAKSWTTTPHVLQVVEADFLRIDQVRREHGAEWKAREGYSLTYLPFIARAVSIALAKFPRLNATYEADRLVLHRRINLGFAVDLNFDGLMVPVVKDVPNKSLPQIAREINDLAQRARTGKLKPDELAEGTYTISNNGSFGTLITASIIYPGQTAILSTDAIRKRPVVIEGPDGDSIAIRPVGMLAQTFDHRSVDGAYSAAFLREVKTIIETRNWAQALSA